MTRGMRSVLAFATILVSFFVLAPAAHADRRVTLRVGVVVRDSYAWPRYGYGWPDCSPHRRSAGACRSGPYDTSGLAAGAVAVRGFDKPLALPPRPKIQFKLGEQPTARPLFWTD